MTSKELIQAHIGFLEQNMKHDSVLQPSLIGDDMLEIEAYKKVLKDLEILEILKEWLVYDEYEEAVMTYRDIPLDIKEKIMRWLNNEK